MPKKTKSGPKPKTWTTRKTIPFKTKYTQGVVKIVTKVTAG